MMVIFTSRSEKKAILTVRKILDNYAERIGNDTWQTCITEKGLQAVYTALKRNATKNMAVSCRWIRSRRSAKLLWTVGRKEAFDSDGRVPVNTTAKNLNHSEWENDWQYMPLLKAYVAVASVLHDWGKASRLFQDKLEENACIADPFRHEWVSCKLLESAYFAYYDQEDEFSLLRAMAGKRLEEKQILAHLAVEKAELCRLSPQLPLYIKAVMWLILSHHRLPDYDEARYVGVSRNSFAEVFDGLTAQWGYFNEEREEAAQKACYIFPHGLLWEESSSWRKQVAKWAGRLLGVLENSKQLAGEIQFNLGQRNLLYYARMVLMLADHYVSSLEEVAADKSAKLWANTRRDGQRKQTLEEHLTKVCSQALKICHQLPMFATKMGTVDNIRPLAKASPAQFGWQDKAVGKIRAAIQEDSGYKASFVVNMASTGCGKTVANAKIVNALSGDGGIRYVLALGLRSLTLQTGDEYRERVGFQNNDLAVLIGSKSVEELHTNEQASASESEAELVPDDLDFLDDISADEKSYMDVFFAQGNKGAAKNRAFLLKPVLVATIDHVMSATESVRGGRQILPAMRLLSSDLVIDEIDDFVPEDLMAISRLVHLAGMFGRNVIISSATIPPDLAEGLYHTYSDGIACCNEFFGRQTVVRGFWCDEFKAVSSVLRGEDVTGFRKAHAAFIATRLKHLAKMPVLRSGFIADVAWKVGEKNAEYLHEAYFSCIKDNAVRLHRDNYVIDSQTGKAVSIGIIRLANINPCAELGCYLLGEDWPEDTEAFTMIYHSRQILLLRHYQEKYLDSVLKRKSQRDADYEFKDPVIRAKLDNSRAENIIFIVVATPVEEIGRDHDFDWAIVEPSSYRSVIQMAGRVRRHRADGFDYSSKNVAVLQYNIRALKGEVLAYRYPGFETNKDYALKSHDLHDILQKYLDRPCIDATFRIAKPKSLSHDCDMVHLEHKVMEDYNNWEGCGPGTLPGWDKEYWWLTALPQRINKFRRGQRQRNIYAVYEEGEVEYYEYQNNDFVKITKSVGIERRIMPEKAHCWLERDYVEALRSYAKSHFLTELENDEAETLKKISRRFGEISLPDREGAKWIYNDQYGLIKELKKDD